MKTELNHDEQTKCKIYSEMVLNDLIPIKFRTNTLKNIHHHSFCHFMNVLVKQIIEEPNGYILDRGKDGNKIWIVKQYFEDPYYLTPSIGKDVILTPQMAKKKSMTYSIQLRVKYRQVLEIIQIDTQEVVEHRMLYENDIALANIPAMVRSPYCSLEYFKHKDLSVDECKYDEGGYFIISGRTKQIVPQESLKKNKILVLQKKSHGTTVISSEVRSSNLNMQIVTITVALKYEKNKKIVLTMPQLWGEIPFFVILRALGMQSDREIIEHICLGNQDEDMMNILQETCNIYPRQLENEKDCCLLDIINTEERAKVELLQYIRQHIREDEHTKDGMAKRLLCLEHIFENDLLPHMNDGVHSKYNKAKYLCLMANKLIQVILERRKIDDRDSYANKKAHMVGELLGHVFKKAFQTQLRETQRHYKKRAGNEARNIKNMICPDISHNIRTNIIDKNMNQAITKGEFALGLTHVIKGVSMELANQTRVDTLSMQMRVKATVIDKNIKTIANRLYHNTQAFTFCPVETPEGQNTGHHKHLSLTAEMTVPDIQSAEYVRNFIEEQYKNKSIGIKWLADCVPLDFQGKTKLFLNGNWLGVVLDYLKLVKMIRELRFRKLIHYHTSVYYEQTDNEVHISTMGGRFVRPLLVVRNGFVSASHAKIRKIASTANNWDEVIDMFGDDLEYLDVNELMHAMIALKPSELYWNEYRKKNNKDFKMYSHCEFHPFMMFGKVAANIPFPEYNQSPRNMYQSSHGRQAIGQPNTNYKKEHNMTLIYTLNYIQRPLIQTHAMPWLHTTDLPAGQNITVAIMSYTGFNQEDSFIMNKNAIDAGLFKMSYYKKYEATQKKGYDTGKMDKFEKPHPEMVGNMRNSKFYEKLNRDGLVKKGTFVSNMDFIIGKITPTSSNKNSKPFRDSSVAIKSNTSGYVDQVIKTYNQNRDERRIVRIRSVRSPNVGDKLTSRCGQKGTVGLILEGRDMPYTSEGIIPDVIINPHCLPSRMTAGLLIEFLVGKKAACDGNIVNGTAFTNLDLNKICDSLEENGFNRYGLSTMTNGMTGERLQARIMVGTAFYQRLKHMVADKIHTRSKGPIQTLTRQPSEGRTNDGGLKVGEMERDTIIAHGIPYFAQERLMKESDETLVRVCRQCGWFAHKDKKRDRYICNKCKRSDTISEIKMPYVFKLILQTLKTVNIDSKMIISNALLE